LVELRTSLRRTMLQSPLCDERGFAEGVKRAFREMWRRYCAGEPPAPFAIADLD
jgi:predicted O-linked N-acetylglucosamine transferase (SPINDLY family)